VQDVTQPQKQGSTGKQTTQLKLIKSPTAPYPKEALKKNIAGKVILSIVVDANGRVSDAKALGGPSELFQAALDSVKQWEFEPPAKAPVVTTAEVAYGHPRECPGSVSDVGGVSFATRLKAERGTLIYLDDDDDIDQPWPPYPTEDRKAGVAGEMVLSIRVNAEGKVINVRVVKSLSPHLDDAAVETVRTWRFKPKAGNPDSLPDDFPLHVLFQPMCHMEF